MVLAEEKQCPAMALIAHCNESQLPVQLRPGWFWRCILDPACATVLGLRAHCHRMLSVPVAKSPISTTSNSIANSAHIMTRQDQFPSIKKQQKVGARGYL